MRAILLGIITAPSVYNKLRDELDIAVKEGRLSVSKDRVIKDKEAQQLPYLAACIKEVS